MEVGLLTFYLFFVDHVVDISIMNDQYFEREAVAELELCVWLDESESVVCALQDNLVPSWVSSDSPNQFITPE